MRGIADHIVQVAEHVVAVHGFGVFQGYVEKTLKSFGLGAPGPEVFIKRVQPVGEMAGADNKVQSAPKTFHQRVQILLQVGLKPQLDPDVDPDLVAVLQADLLQGI